MLCTQNIPLIIKCCFLEMFCTTNALSSQWCDLSMSFSLKVVSSWHVVFLKCCNIGQSWCPVISMSSGILSVPECPRDVLINECFSGICVPSQAEWVAMQDWVVIWTACIGLDANWKAVSTTTATETKPSRQAKLFLEKIQKQYMQWQGRLLWKWQLYIKPSKLLAKLKISPNTNWLTVWQNSL